MFTDCIVPEGGYPTHDGYLRVLTKQRKYGGKLKMLHRLEWEKVHGPIPEGFEVDHKCKNRKCQNVNHLQLLTRSEHKTKDNSMRYLERQLEVLKFADNFPGLTPKEIAGHLGVSYDYVTNVFRQYPKARHLVSFHNTA